MQLTENEKALLEKFVVHGLIEFKKPFPASNMNKNSLE